MCRSEAAGCFLCQLYIQQQGVAYPTSTETRTDSKTGETIVVERPILPIFRTAEIPGKMLEQMGINPAWATISGPGFGVMGDSP